MLGSHLTLNRTLATHILLVRLQPQPLPPSYREKLVILILIQLTPFFSLSRTLCERSWTTEELDDPSSGRLRGDSTMTSQVDPGVEPGPMWLWGMVCFTFASRHLIVVCTQTYLPLMYCIKAVVCQLYEMLYPCSCNVVISCRNPRHMALSYVAVGSICASSSGLDGNIQI